MMGGRVSVIMPFLNAAPYLAEAVQSVRAQSLPDWELLLLDDGSNDQSPAIAEAEARADPRVRYLPRAPEDRKGAAAARNRGLVEAQGEYLCFLDADDLFLPFRLERHVAILERSPEAAAVVGPTKWWHPHEPARDWDERVTFRGLVPPPRLLDGLVLMLQGHVPCICAITIRRSEMASVGTFEEAFKLYEDQTLLVKLFAEHPVYCDDMLTAWYRQHDRSTSAAAEAAETYNRLRPHQARLAFLEWTRAFLQERQLVRGSTERALRCAFASMGAERGQLNNSDRLLLASHALKRRARWLTHRGQAAIKRMLQGSR